MAGTVTRRMIETRRRGILGWIFLLLFWSFNLLMVIALFAGIQENAKRAPNFVDPAMRQAHDVGTGIGIMILVAFWAAGATVFGLLAHFSRGRRELLEVETRT